MDTFAQMCSGLSYHILNVNLLVLEDTSFDSWIGASIRNNFLYASQKLELEKGDTLFSLINKIPICEDHPLFKAVSGGATRGYLIIPTSHTEVPAPFTLKKHERLSFSLVLIGNLADYYQAFIQAIRQMCELGLGKPRCPFLFLDVCEEGADKKQRTIFSAAMNTPEALARGIVFENPDVSVAKTLGIRYSMPTMLYSKRNKKDSKVSYQDKMNGFPSFYQLVRSVCFRLAKLYALYYKPDDPDGYTQLLNSIEDYLEDAEKVSLLSANIRKTMQMSTMRKENSNRIKLPGYVGELYFEGNFNMYSNLLNFAQNLGIGKDTSYGLGKFEVIE